MLLNPDVAHDFMEFCEASRKAKENVEPDKQSPGNSLRERLPRLHERRMKMFKNSNPLNRFQDAKQFIFNETMAVLLEGEAFGPRVYDSILKRQQAEIDELCLQVDQLKEMLAELTQQEDKGQQFSENERESSDGINGDELRERIQESIKRPESPFFGMSARESLRILQKQRLAKFEKSSSQEKLWNASEYVAMEILALHEEGRLDGALYDQILSRQQVEIDERRLIVESLQERVTKLLLARKQEDERRIGAGNVQNVTGRNDAEQ